MNDEWQMFYRSYKIFTTNISALIYRVSCSPHRGICRQDILSPTRIKDVEDLDGAVLTRCCQLILLKRTPIQTMYLEIILTLLVSERYHSNITIQQNYILLSSGQLYTAQDCLPSAGPISWCRHHALWLEYETTENSNALGMILL